MEGTNNITFESLCEEISDGQKAWLDRLHPALSNTDHLHWCNNGYLTLNGFIPAPLIDAYCARYERDNGKDAAIGYRTGTAYCENEEMKNLALYSPLTNILSSLIGEPMGLSLCLTNWQSTERNWHQDDYLNPSEVNGHYLAVWIALDDIHPDAGPFEFVPGSHKWPVMRGEKVRALLPESQRNDPFWPWKTQKLVSDLFEAEIEKRGAKTEKWAGKKGDVLIWHSWLAHRGSKPENPELLRKSLIVHYSGINHRPDMQKPVLYENGESKGYYFPF